MTEVFPSSMVGTNADPSSKERFMYIGLGTLVIIIILLIIFL